MDFYLSKPAVMGFHISGFDVLLEDFDNPDQLSADVEVSVEFLKEMHSWTRKYSEKDGLDRLFMLEMTENQYKHIFDDFHNQTAGIAVVPFSFGTVKLHHRNEEITGTLIYEEIKGYMEEAPEET